MASGRSHALATMLSAMCGVLQVPTNDAGAAWISGSLYGLLSTPDLDQIESSGSKTGGYYGQYVIRETFGGGRLGDFIEHLWWTYWQVYAGLLIHRGFISHFPVISTLVRMIYGFPFIAFFYILLHDKFGYFIIALIASDTIHFLMDWKIWRKLGFFKQ